MQKVTYSGSRNQQKKPIFELERGIAIPHNTVRKNGMSVPDNSYNWGYFGVNSRKLAQFILADFYQTEPPQELVDIFAWEVVKNWGDEWAIDTNMMDVYMRDIYYTYFSEGEENEE